MKSELRLCNILDPREADAARREPIAGAVCIPLAELGERAHELPSKQRPLLVAGPAELAERAVAWLRERDRAARICTEWKFDRGERPRARGRLWQPAEFLAETLPRIPVGSALDLACGTGRDAVHLAATGWRVTAVDVLPDALDRARGLARRYLDEPRRIDWLCHDLQATPPAFEDRFDLITAFRYLQRPLFDSMRAWLRPGGHLLIETFTTLHRERHGKPSSDAHVLRLGELRELVAGFQVRHYSEEWRGAAHTARCWASALSHSD